MILTKQMIKKYCHGKRNSLVKFMVSMAEEQNVKDFKVPGEQSLNYWLNAERFPSAVYFPYIQEFVKKEMAKEER